MSVFDFLTEGPSGQTSGTQAGQTASSQQTATQNRGASSTVGATSGASETARSSQIADWLRPHAQNVLDLGQTVSGQEFQSYDPNAAQPYMNPYTDAVLAPTLQEINRQAANESAGIGSQAKRLGAFGGSRQAILESDAERRRLGAIADATAGAHDQAFRTGTDIALGEHRRGQEFGSNRLRDYLAAVSGVPMDRSETAATTEAQQTAQQGQTLDETMQMINSAQQSEQATTGIQDTEGSLLGGLGGLAGIAATVAGLFSDKNMKTKRRKISDKDVLDALDEFDVESWEYKHRPGERRVGPMAQDMEKIGVGNGRMLPPNEMASLSLRGVKALADKVNKLEMAGG